MCQGLDFPNFGVHLHVQGRSLFQWHIFQPQSGSWRGPDLPVQRLMQNVIWLLVFILNFACIFRFPPTSIFIVTRSLDRLPTKAEDPNSAMRHLVLPYQMPTWKFQDQGRGGGGGEGVNYYYHYNNNNNNNKNNNNYYYHIWYKGAIKYIMNTFLSNLFDTSPATQKL